MKPVCRKCKKPLDPSEGVRLWNGRDYCCKCIETAHKGLSHFVKKHETLVVEYRVDSWKHACYLWKHQVAYLALMCVACALFFFVVIVLGQLSKSDYGFGEILLYSWIISFGLSSLMFVLLVLISLLCLPAALCHVEFRASNGEVNLTYRKNELAGKWDHLRYRVCSWYPGLPWKTPCLLVVYPLEGTHVRIPLTAETYPILRAAFKLLR